MNLAGYRDRRLSENYFEPCSLHAISWRRKHKLELRRCYTRQFLLPCTCLAILLLKVEVSSTFRNASRNVAMNFSHVAQRNTFPATCVATFNGIGQSNCSFCARQVLFQDIMGAELRTASKITEKRCPV